MILQKEGLLALYLQKRLELFTIFFLILGGTLRHEGFGHKRCSRLHTAFNDHFGSVLEGVGNDPAVFYRKGNLGVVFVFKQETHTACRGILADFCRSTEEAHLSEFFRTGCKGFGDIEKIDAALRKS